MSELTRVCRTVSTIAANVHHTIQLIISSTAAVPGRPDPPVVGKVTHHSVELYWSAPEHSPAAGPLSYTVQDEGQLTSAAGAGRVYQ